MIVHLEPEGANFREQVLVSKANLSGNFVNAHLGSGVSMI